MIFSIFKKRVTSLFILNFFLFYSASGQLPRKYSFEDIPKMILPRANAVVRSRQILLKIKSKSEAFTTIKSAITILNNKADNLRYISVEYDKFRSVSGIKGNIYDKNGTLIYRISSYDIVDVAGEWAPGIVSDVRAKHIVFPVRPYPYTIEYEYKIKDNGTLSYPGLNFDPRADISIERYGIQCVVPKSFKFRFKEHNLKFPVDSMLKGKSKVYVWQEENIPVKSSNNWLQENLFAESYLLTAPEAFSYGGYDGNMSTWKDFGNWIRKINHGSDVPDADIIATVKQLTQGITNKKDIVRKLYEYIQANTRYVRISLGLGGLQPAPANEVKKTGYGDCKALSNYMCTLLNAAGINSYYTLVKSGYYKNIDPDFPMDWFDHIIVSVPIEKDTIWLECTDQDQPFGFLGSFTDNRYALAVGNDDVQLVHTPCYTNKTNKATSIDKIDISRDGNATFLLEINRTGILYETVYDKSIGTKKDATEWFAKILSNENIKLDTVQFNLIKTSVPDAKVIATLSLKNFASQTGAYLAFNPCLLLKTSYMSEKPINGYIATPYELNDSIIFNLPDGCLVESVPETVNIQNEIGSYHTSCGLMSNKIVYRRHFVINSGTYNKEQGKTLTNWINKIADLDSRLVLLKLNGV
jgi:hypothetical protein